jgi:hypothetical protein
LDANMIFSGLIAIITCLIGFLINLTLQVKRDNDKRDAILNTKFDGLEDEANAKLDNITQRLSHMVLAEDYKQDKKEMTIKLDEHGDRILILEITVKQKEIR